MTTMNFMPRPPRSHALDHARQQQRATRQLRDDDMFVHGVRPIPDSAETIKRGYANPGGEVSIGPSADRRLIQSPVNLFGKGFRFFIKGRYAFSPLHRQPVDATLDT